MVAGLSRIGLASVVMAGLATASLGCGETARQAIARVRPAYDERRDNLAALAEWLPPPGLASEKTWLPERLDPPLVIGGEKDATTGEVIMAEQLLDPDARPARDF